MKSFEIVSKENPPQTLLTWLEHASSLTNKLKDKLGEAKLLLLNQEVIPNAWWLKHYLGVNSVSVISREILMLSHELPYWYARTFIPIETYRANKAMFDELSHKTMGALIFGDYGVKRIDAKAYCVDKLAFEYQWAKKFVPFEVETLWVRLATYEVCDNHLFYLCEVLLPTLT